MEDEAIDARSIGASLSLNTLVIQLYEPLLKYEPNINLNLLTDFGRTNVGSGWLFVFFLRIWSETEVVIE